MEPRRDPHHTSAGFLSRQFCPRLCPVSKNEHSLNTGSSTFRHSPITTCLMHLDIDEQQPERAVVSLSPRPRMGPVAMGQNSGRSLLWLRPRCWPRRRATPTTELCASDAETTTGCAKHPSQTRCTYMPRIWVASRSCKVMVRARGTECVILVELSSFARLPSPVYCVMYCYLLHCLFLAPLRLNSIYYSSRCAGTGPF
jgi:hypothetical protein